jgi:tryptophan synthase beta subunit
MTSSGTPPGGKKRPSLDSDDPWDRLTRNARIAQGQNPADDDLGDTSRLVGGQQEEGGHVTGTFQKEEMLKLVEDSLAAAPDRGDLWMMRFEVQRALGMKQEFLSGMVQAWKKPAVFRQLDWPLLRAMWQEVAPGEPLPDIIKAPDASGTPGAPRPVAVATPPGTPRIRRFADLAMKIAERELTILGKAYAALSSRPGFFEDFARKVMPMVKRPTPLQLSERLSRAAGEHARIYLKREDKRVMTAELDHAAAQCYIAGLLGRAHVVTANDVDAHALALAEMAPRFNLKLTVVVRPEDPRDNPGLIDHLHSFGAIVEPMPVAGMLGNDPREGAVRLWQKSAGATHLVLSLGTAPPPYPAMASAFRSLLGHETELQFRAQGGGGRPRTMVAAVASEADSLGFVLPQLGRKEVELVYAEPEPGGIASWRASQRLRAYNGAIREHTLLFGTGRVEHVALSDATAESMRERLNRDEALNVSLEDARAVALVQLLAQRDRTPRDFVVLVA